MIDEAFKTRNCKSKTYSQHFIGFLASFLKFDSKPDIFLDKLLIFTWEMNIRKKNGKNMNSQRISFLSVAWLVLPLSPAPCGSCVTSLFLEGHFCIHLEVASDSFCFLINSSWLLVFILYVFSFFFLGFNLYCLKGIHFS